MAPWFLIVIAYSTGVMALPFPNLDSCEAARVEFLQRVQREMRPFPPAMTVMCLRGEP